jgi:GT2 family glycosyltransferase
MPSISIIIPTYNRLNRLKHVIASLEKQAYQLDDVEVIIISDGSTDGTDAYLNTIETPLRLIKVTQPNKGVAAARNRGIEYASGDIVLFLDDDVVPTPQLLAEHLRIHQSSNGEVVVLGPMLTPPDFQMAPWVRWEQAMLEKQYSSMLTERWQPTARQFYTGNTSLARRHIIAAGKFDETFRRAEDVELAYRLAERGLRFLFNPQAIGYHYADRSFWSWLNTPYVYGRNDIIFARDKGQTWLLSVIQEEFCYRHVLVKLLVQACLDRKAISALTIGGLRLAAVIMNRLGQERLCMSAYSGIFNLRHYQGIADELGGRRHFFA